MQLELTLYGQVSKQKKNGAMTILVKTKIVEINFFYFEVYPPDVQWAWALSDDCCLELQEDERLREASTSRDTSF